MSMIPSLSFSGSSSANSRTDDTGFKAQNTPTTVIAGNGGNFDWQTVLQGVANLNLTQNEPAERALSYSPAVVPGGGGILGGGGIPPVVMLAGVGVLLWLLLRH